MPPGLVEVPLDEGTPPRLRAQRAGLPPHLAPFEAFGLARGVRAPVATPEVLALDLTGPTALRRHAPNLLRLDRWQLALAGGGCSERPVAPMTLVEQLSSAGLAYAPRLHRPFGLPPRLDLPALDARYSARVRVQAPIAATVVIEPDGIRGDWSISLDGGPARLPQEARPIDAHQPGCLGIDLGILSPGSHELVVQVRCAEPDHGLVTALFLSGDMGVAMAPCRITAPADTGTIGDWVGNRLPFFAGLIEHRARLELAPPASAECELELRLPASVEDAIEISCNGHQWRGVPWSPRRIVVPTGELRQGINDIQVRVRSTLDRAMTGSWTVRPRPAAFYRPNKLDTSAWTARRGQAISCPGRGSGLSAGASA